MKGVLFAPTTATEYKDGERKQGGIFSLFLFITEKPGKICHFTLNAKGETAVSSQTSRQSILLAMPSVPQRPGGFSIHYAAVIPVNRRHTGIHIKGNRMGH